MTSRFYLVLVFLTNVARAYADMVLRDSDQETGGTSGSISTQTVTVMTIAVVVVGAIVWTIYRVGRHRQPEAWMGQMRGRLARRHPTGRGPIRDPRLNGAMDDIEPLPLYTALPRPPPPAYGCNGPPPAYTTGGAYSGSPLML